MHLISKRFDFSASHRLRGLNKGHPCSRVHGHNYSVTLLFSGELDEAGMVVDYRKLDAFKRWLDGRVDHRHLNEVFTFNPTAELLAHEFFSRAQKLKLGNLVGVRVKETDKTEALYAPGA